MIWSAMALPEREVIWGESTTELTAALGDQSTTESTAALVDFSCHRVESLDIDHQMKLSFESNSSVEDKSRIVGYRSSNEVEFQK
ncbi:hypothetical protein LWI29_004076 [Acer saccharum]|uniref:Uncharacterized protein n=1 Tax=Acer saccharum TaxID=4024 RepID=A0AA39VLV3_ACESA|nr:hypothetical protein LWI29_004076 [Acer saccharum]